MIVALVVVAVTFSVACSSDKDNTHQTSDGGAAIDGARADASDNHGLLGQDVDILFVIDNSPSMLAEQQLLAEQFPQLIEALRSERLGSDGSGKPCTVDDRSGCKIPNVHIGVITSDIGLGIADSPFVSCDELGDGAKLQAEARQADCLGPSDPWISYEDGLTNIASGNIDPIARIAEGFACIARVGDDGCGYERQLEAARRALDPALGINPGFVRPEAALAVVFITDEDDCSAKDGSFYDVRDLTLGPPSYRCFEYGVSCAEGPDDPRAPGVRSGCQPGGELLTAPVGPGDSYETFFRALKPAGRVVLATIAGPPTPVEVVLAPINPGVPELGEIPTLQPSCPAGLTAEQAASTMDGAYPAIRIEALVHAFTETTGDVPGQFTNICDGNFGTALAELGRRVSATL